MHTAHLFLPTTVSTRVTVTASKAGIPQLQNHPLDRLRITFLYSNKTTRSKDQADQVDPPSNTDRAFESAREQLRPLSWSCLLWKFPTRISSPDPRRPGKGRRRCPQRHSPTTGWPRENLISEILGSQIHGNYGSIRSLAICRLTLRYLHTACQGTLVILPSLSQAIVLLTVHINCCTCSYMSRGEPEICED